MTTHTMPEEMSRVSTEDLARTLLDRLKNGDRVQNNIATDLQTILPARTTYRKDGTTTAVHDVFNTPELLEMIFLESDVKTLLISQRISRQLKDTITGSTKLQDKLGFRLKPEPDASNISHFHMITPESRDIVAINPFLADSNFRQHLAVRDIIVSTTIGKYDLRLEINIIFDTIEKVKALPKGSWEDLIVVQPSSRKEDRWYLSHTFEKGSAFTKSVGSGDWYDALTLGEMVEVLLERWEEMQADPWKSASDYDKPKEKGKADGNEWGGKW